MKTYEEFIHDAERLYSRAVRSVNKPEIFTPEIIYNIMGMAIEKYIMGFLIYNNRLADNHTFFDLLNAVSAVEEPGEELAEVLNFMERYQDICSIDGYFRKPPAPEELPQIIRAGTVVKDFIYSRIKELA